MCERGVYDNNIPLAAGPLRRFRAYNVERPDDDDIVDLTL